MLGHIEIIFFLVVDVGRPAAAVGVSQATTSAFDLAKRMTELPVMQLLQGWDPDNCARIDAADKHGNTAAHMAIIGYASADVFKVLHFLCASPSQRRRLWTLNAPSSMLHTHLLHRRKGLRRLGHRCAL